MSSPDQSFSESSSVFSVLVSFSHMNIIDYKALEKSRTTKMEESCKPESLHGGKLLTDHKRQLHNIVSLVKNKYI